MCIPGGANGAGTDEAAARRRRILDDRHSFEFSGSMAAGLSELATGQLLQRV